MIGKPRIQTAVTGGNADGVWCARSVANQPSVKPSARLPASPRNTRAERRHQLRKLNSKKPQVAPIKGKIWLRWVSCPACHAQTASQNKEVTVMPPARPSIPSDMFTALIRAIRQKSEKGIAKSCSSMTPNPNKSPRYVTDTPSHETMHTPARACIASFVLAERWILSSMAPVMRRIRIPAYNP